MSTAVPSHPPHRSDGLPPIIGSSQALQRAVQLARRFAPTELPILLVGPTGTGKELVAQHIHAWSACRGELVDINCAALPRELVEALLFGYQKGAFTGAIQNTPGLIEAAHGGTLFLDELCSLPAEAQAKLLRVLERGEFRRLAETTKRRAAFRLVAATQEPLALRVGAGTFRADLYQRVAGVVIELPPLAERPEDILALAEHVAGERDRTLTSSAMDALVSYWWPGNVRELKAVVERACWLSHDDALGETVIAQAIGLGTAHARSELENGVTGLAAHGFAELLAAGWVHHWHARRMAEALGIHRATLFRWLKAAGTSLRQLRESHQSRDGRATPATLG